MSIRAILTPVCLCYLCGMVFFFEHENSSAADKQSFNPAISLILDGKYARFSEQDSDYSIAGFALADEVGPPEAGFSLGESELTASANIDNRFYGSLSLALSPENEVELEEAYIQTLGLGMGLTVRAGRFFSGIGYLNEHHAHRWDFADQPLVYRAMLGGQFGDDGVGLRWVAPTNIFLEFGAEALRGESFPAGGAADDGTGAYTAFFHMGGDVGVSHNWRFGLSYLHAESIDRETGDGPDLFSGKTELGIADIVWKWAPLGNSKSRYLKLQAEYFYRDESDSENVFNASPYAAKQQGWYAQAVFQFIPRWRIGLRHDSLQSDDVQGPLLGTALDNQGHDPRNTSVMLDYSHSEFSRLRLQYNHDRARALDETDRQYYVQYIMSLGAHGAHKY